MEPRHQLKVPVRLKGAVHVICGRVTNWTGSLPGTTGKVPGRELIVGWERHGTDAFITVTNATKFPEKFVTILQRHLQILNISCKSLRKRLSKTSVLPVCPDSLRVAQLRRREQNPTTFKSYQNLPNPATTSFSLNTLGGDSFFPSSLTVINKAGNTTRPSG